MITKHPGTGGLVSVGTVTAQLLYEIAGPAYLGPDVTAHFDTIALAAGRPDRVRITGVRGSRRRRHPEGRAQQPGGFRNQMTFVLTGLDVEAKADRVPKSSCRRRSAAERCRARRWPGPTGRTRRPKTGHRAPARREGP